MGPMKELRAYPYLAIDLPYLSIFSSDLNIDTFARQTHIVLIGCTIYLNVCYSFLHIQTVSRILSLLVRAYEVIDLIPPSRHPK